MFRHSWQTNDEMFLDEEKVDTEMIDLGKNPFVEEDET